VERILTIVRIEWSGPSVGPDQPEAARAMSGGRPSLNRSTSSETNETHVSGNHATGGDKKTSQEEKSVWHVKDTRGIAEVQFRSVIEIVEAGKDGQSLY